ncbi:tetratricopeptide repeat protein [Parabacteroides johnsonii]|uniref:tetratricopeptide repeat protein n=1 Tax=Parabacteroides johnsonii TaxID=387661 RepID=UPI00243190B7|nr:hypothetical protein [Parabacteroides johnsonii]
MKNIVIFVLLSIAFFSCRENQVASEQMDRAETLLPVYPDSAYVILEGVELPDKLNERQFARWCMLYCRAADKLFKDMLYAEQLDRALGWYKSHGTAEEQAWIGLYLGRSFVEDKLFIPATKAYSEALDLAKKKHLYNVAGYICSYMADLYTYTGQGSEERRKYEEAADYFKKAGNIRSYAFALRDISITWVFEDSLSLALELMLKADSIVTGMNDSVGIASIANGLGNIYEHLDQIDKAKSYFFRSLAYDTTEQAPTYMALSHMFLNSNLLDSARFYIENTNLKSRNPYVYSDRLYTKYMIEEESNNPLEALQYLEQYCEAQDSLYDVQKQVDIIDAEKRHNSLTVLQQNQKLYSTIYALSGLILVIFLTGILFHLYKDRKRLDKINKQQLLLDEKELLLTKLESEIKQNEIVNLHIVKKETPQIHEKMIQAKKEILMLKCEKLQYSSLFQELKERANDKKKYGQTLSEQDWENLKEQIDSACPNWQTAIQDVETLKKAEIETCYLSFLNISIKSEAMLLGINPDSANKRRLRTRQSLGLTNSKTGIYEFIIRKTLENIVI